MSDKTLIEALKRGDEDAFRTLVEGHEKMVINTCYGFTHKYDEAEDLAQEVFIQVFKSVHTFREDAKISTWLYRIAVNKCLNHIRSNKRRSIIDKFGDLLFSESEFEPQSSIQNQPDKILENKENAERLHKAIAQLPENQQIAFTLSKFKGLPNKQIADVMKTSLSSVEALMNRAKKNMQKNLISYLQNNLY